MQIEFMDPWLLDYGLNLSHQLDVSLNITRKTRVLSQRDVPGTVILVAYTMEIYIIIIQHFDLTQDLSIFISLFFFQESPSL